MAVYVQDFKTYERSHVSHRRLHAGKNQYQSFIFKQLSQIHHRAAYTFRVVINWFMHTCRMLTGHADCLRCYKWDLSFTEFPHQCVVLWAAVVSGCFNIPCAAHGHSAHPGRLRPGAAPAQLQRCRLRALRGAGAARQRQGRVHLHCQDPQVCRDTVLHAGRSLFLLQRPQRKQDQALRLKDLHWTFFKKLCVAFNNIDANCVFINTYRIV